MKKSIEVLLDQIIYARRREWTNWLGIPNYFTLYLIILNEIFPYLKPPDNVCIECRGIGRIVPTDPTKTNFQCPECKGKGIKDV